MAPHLDDYRQSVEARRQPGGTAFSRDVMMAGKLKLAAAYERMLS